MKTQLFILVVAFFLIDGIVAQEGTTGYDHFKPGCYMEQCMKFDYRKSLFSLSQYAAEGKTIIGDYRKWMQESRHVRKDRENTPMFNDNLRFTADPSENTLITTKHIHRGDWVFQTDEYHYIGNNWQKCSDLAGYGMNYVADKFMVMSARMPVHAPWFNSTICTLALMNYERSRLKVLTNMIPLKSAGDHYFSLTQSITNDEINLLRGTPEFYDLVHLRAELHVEVRDVFNHAGRKTNPQIEYNLDRRITTGNKGSLPSEDYMISRNFIITNGVTMSDPFGQDFNIRILPAFAPISHAAIRQSIKHIQLYDQLHDFMSYKTTNGIAALRFKSIGTFKKGQNFEFTYQFKNNSMFMLDHGFVPDYNENALDCIWLTKVFPNQLYTLLTAQQRKLLMAAGYISPRQCHNQPSFKHFVNGFCNIMMYNRNQLSTCINHLDLARKMGKSDKEVKETILYKCPPLRDDQKCEWDLRRYATEQLQDSLYTYETKVKTVTRYLEKTEELPEPSYAHLFLKQFNNKVHMISDMLQVLDNYPKWPATDQDNFNTLEDIKGSAGYGIHGSGDPMASIKEMQALKASYGYVSHDVPTNQEDMVQDGGDQDGTPIGIKRADYDVDGNLVEESIIKGDETMFDEETQANIEPEQQQKQQKKDL